MYSKLPNLPNIRGRYKFGADLSKLCWLGVGGVADVLFTPFDLEDLADFLSNFCGSLPIFILGAGSNVLIRQSGFHGVVIRLGRAFNYITHEGVIIKAGCSSLDLGVAEYAVSHSLSGLEFLSGIPGTVGGAIAMNAGAYGIEVKDALISVRSIDFMGNIRDLSVNEMGYVYRGAGIKDNIFLEARFQSSLGDQEEIRNKMLDIKRKRESIQPIKTKTAGSTFKNPNSNLRAWELIDMAGCRGLNVGRAMISNMHCNFINVEYGATALDVENLILEVQERVLKCTGILLEPEVKIIG